MRSPAPTPRAGRPLSSHVSTTIRNAARGGAQAWRLALTLAALLSVGAAGSARAAAPDTAYLAELQQRAQALGLHRQPLWLDLLHVKPRGGFGAPRSLADDPDFFTSPVGKTDAAAELAATLAAFFDTQRQFKGEQTAQCRFRTRYTWLAQQLHFDAQRLPPQPCPRYDEWRAGVAASRLTLVYAAAFINSPASMFGHTLFRLDPPAGPADAPLLSYSISYAVSDEANPGDPFFELKGLVGLYPGEFTNSPYYRRVRAYTHMEDRDLWEYELDLSPEEIERLLSHTWELGFTRFDYYFFDENCAYHLLSLLDVARPGLHLTDRFTWSAIPSDTVKAVASVPGLVRHRTFRASAGSQLMNRAGQLGAEQQRLARDLAGMGPAEIRGQSSAPAAQAATAALAALPEDTRARVLELAERQVSQMGARGKLSNDPAQARRMALLGQRAALPSLAEPPVPEADNAPEAGHATSRIEALLALPATHHGGDGATRDDTRAYARLNLHPAYHELLDPEPGFAPGAQILFFDTSLRLRPGGGGLRLDKLVPVDVLSVTPQHLLRDGASWKVNGGWQRALGQAPDRAPLEAGLNGGPGWSWHLGGDASPNIAYALMDNQVWWHHSPSTLTGGTRWQLGSGVHLGLLLQPLPDWRLHLQARQRWFTRGEASESQWSLRSRWSLDKDRALLADCQRSRRGASTSPLECGLGLQQYW